MLWDMVTFRKLALELSFVLTVSLRHKKHLTISVLHIINQVITRVSQLLWTKYFRIGNTILCRRSGSQYPPDTGRKSNVHKTLRRRLGRTMKFLCTFNLRTVSRGIPWSEKGQRIQNTVQHCRQHTSRIFLPSVRTCSTSH